MAADLTVLIGQQRFLQLVAETTWGNVPGSPTWLDVPVNDYNVRFKPKRRSGQARVGQFQRRYGSNTSGNPSGSLVAPLYGWKPTGATTSLAQYLLEWGFTDQENKFPISKSAQWEYANHEDDKGHTGLRVNTATLEGSDAGISLTLELIGKTASNFTGSATAPNSRYQVAEFLFPDCSFTINSTAMNISSFKWSVQRNLDVIFENSPSPLSMPKTAWNETFSVTPLKADSTYDALRDSLGMQETTATLVLKGLNEGTMTNTWTQVSIAFGRLSLVDSDESGGVSAQMNPLTYDVLKPDSSANGSVMTWTTN
jgi:Phage tail tube protein